MMNNLACARARESAEAWLADRKLALPVPPRVSAAFVEQAMVDAFAAGWGHATTPETEAEVNQIVASLIRDAQAAGGDDAADDAAQRIVAYLGAIHREEQDLWAARLKEADAVLNEKGEAVPIYRLGEAHDLVSAMDGAALIEEGVGWVKVHGVPDARALFNILRLAKIAAEAGVPDEENPEASAEWFERARLIVPGEDSLVAHGERCPADEPPRSAPWRTEGVADLTAFRLNTGDPRFDPAAPVTINGFTYHPAKGD